VNKAKEHISHIKLKLRSFDNKENLIKTIIGLNVFIVIFFLLNAFLNLLELSGLNSILERTILFYSGISLMGTAFVLFIIIPLPKSSQTLNPPNYKSLSEKVGNYFPDIKDSLKNVLELSDKKNNYSSETLTIAAIEKVYRKVENIDFRKATSYNQTKKFFLFSATAIILSSIVFYSIPGLRAASYRIINYSSEFKQPQKFSFYIEPGNVSVTKNTDVIIKINTIGENPKTINLYTKSIEEPEYIEHKPFPDSIGMFLLRINTLRNSIEYFAKAEGIISNTYKIEVIDKPTISKLQLDISSPNYSGLKKHIQKDNGNIRSLKGSKIDLKIKSTKKLLSGYLLFSDSTKHNLSINKKKASTSFTALRESEYKIIIFDSTKNSNKVFAMCRNRLTK